MARVKFSPIVSSIDGSIGGITFQKNQYGNAVRSKPLPIGQPSSTQLGMRGLMKDLQNMWSGLSSSVQESWNKFSTYSASYSRKNTNSLLSGYNLFLKYNLLRLSAGLDAITSFSYVNIQLPSEALSLAYPTGPLSIISPDYIDPASIWFVFKASNWVTNNRYIPMSSLRQLHPAVTNHNHWDISSEYISIFGTSAQINSTVLVSTIFFATTAPIISKPFITRYPVPYF